MRCPLCGSTNVIVDYAAGTIVCTECGYVIEENIIDVTGGTREHSSEFKESKNAKYKPVRLDNYELLTIERTERARHRRELEKLVKAKYVSDKRLVASLSEALRIDKLEELKAILRVLESQGLLVRRSARIKLAVAEALREYAHGRYPRFKLIAMKFGVSVESLKKVFKSLIREVDVKMLIKRMEEYKSCNTVQHDG